jgi:hypothetical protein
MVPGDAARISADASSAAPSFSPPPASPFSDPSKPVPLPASASVNPYTAPQNIFAEGPFQPLSGPQSVERARSRLLLPAIGMIIVSLLGLGFMGLVGMVVAIDPNRVFKDVGADPAERAGAYAFFIAYFSIGLLSRVVQLLGAIAMLRVRGYALAMAGAISALVPCEIYCCLPSLPLGIWGLIVLMNGNVKRAFQR